MIRRTWVAACFLVGCAPDLDTTRDPVTRGSFGETIYREACQRVAWTAQLDEQAAGLRAVVDAGNAIYGPVCRDNATPPSDAPRKLVALTGQRAAIVAAVDKILPQGFLDPMEAFLEAITALSDDGTMEDVIGKTGEMLAALRDDPQFTAALSHFSHRTGYRPLKASDLVRAVVDYPGIDDLLEQTLDVLLDEQGHASPELHALLTATSAELRSSKPLPMPADQERTLKVATNLMFSTGPEFGTGTPRLLTVRDFRGVAFIPPDGQGKLPAPFVDNNGDGLADVDGFGRFVGGDGKPLALAPPFPSPGDTAKRDGQGRLLDGGGQPVYRYLDLDPTFIGAVTREAAPLLDAKKDDALGLVHGAAALLGPRSAQEKAYTIDNQPVVLQFNGFATDQAALLDLLHAFIQILGDPNADQTLQAARTLFTKYESPTARVVAAALDASDRGKQHPEAQIPATSDLYDDLIPLVVRALRAETRKVNGRDVTLMEDVLDALENPHSKGVAPMIAREMRYKDRISLNQNDQTISGNFVTPVDYSQPDSDWNRSVFQRKAHLVHDANGAVFCNKPHSSLFGVGDIGECNMFKVKDLGLFFVLTIADRSITDDKSRPETRNAASFREQMDPAYQSLVTDDALGDFALETLTGISGFTRFPTPQAASRALFLDHDHQSSFMQDTTDPVKCVDGDTFIDVHNDTIFGWEVPLPGNPSGFANDNFYDALRPLVDAFAMHDECVARDDRGVCTQKQNAAKIFVDILAALHTHWGSKSSTYFGHGYQSQDPAQPRYSAGDGVFTYQKLAAEVLADSDLMPSLTALAPTLRTMTLDGTINTPPARPYLVKSMSYLLDPAAAPAGLAYRSGKVTTVKSDGTSPGPHVTPYALLADAYAAKRRALDAAPAGQAGAWRAATSHLVDQMLTVDSANGQWQFHNRRFHGITVALVDFLRGRLAVHGAAGDRDTWVHKTLTQNVTDAVSGPVFAALADLVARLEANQPARDSLYGLLNYLVNQAQSDASFATALTAASDDLQLFLDDPDLVPIAHAMGRAIDPEKGAVESQLRMMRRARALDPNCATGKCTLTTVLRNLYQDTPKGTSPAADVADSIAEVDRASPGSGGDYASDDYRAILDNAYQFLVDEQRGFIRFVEIVKSRRYNP